MTLSVTKLVFWQNYLTFHQAGYIRALAEIPGVEVCWAVEEVLPAVYEKRGYPIPDTGLVRVVVSPSDAEIHELMGDGRGDAVHVFLGIRGMKLSSRAFRISKQFPVRRILMSENRYENGWKLPIRWLLYAYDGLTQKKYIDRILCIGYHGPRGGRKWFSKCGFEVEKILPFLYCLDAYEPGAQLRSGGSEATKIVFVGQLIRRKGLDLLLQALSGITDLAWSLTVVGTGSHARALSELARRLGLESRVEFVGSLPNEEVSNTIGMHDLLVLPSRFDGWGAVVNEAILRGVPVVCSDRCGASDLVLGSQYGKVFKSGDVPELRTAVQECVRLSSEPAFKAAGQAFRSKIMGPAVAKYVLEIVKSLSSEVGNAKAPWLDQLSSADHVQRDSVAVFYHFFPHYRAGIIRALRASHMDVHFYGGSGGVDGIRAFNFGGQDNFHRIATWYLGKVVIQPRVVWESLFASHRTFVFLANPNHVTTWVGAAICRLRGRRVILWGHGFKSAERSVKNCLRKAFYSLASGFFTYGARAKDIAVGFGFKPQSIYVGFNSLDVESQLPYRDATAEGTSGSHEGLNVVCISRLTSACRYDLLLEAAAIAAKRGVHCRISFIGAGPERRRLEETSTLLGLDVTFLGELYDEREIFKVFESADVTVSPGKIGLTAMHSMSYGVPVISNDDFSQQMPEVEAIIAGRTGALFAAGDHLDLADKLCNFKRDFPNRAQTGERCRKMIDHIYNPAKQLDVLDMACAGLPAPAGNDASVLFDKRD